MTKLQLNYEKVCACIPEGITLKGKYRSLITSSIQDSLSTVETPEYREQFRDSPDNIETQVDMYAALLDDVCGRLREGVQKLEPDETKAQKMITKLENTMRTAYATMGLCNVVQLADGTPLLIGYLQEKLGDEQPTSKVIEPALSDYMSKLKIKEYLDELRVTPRLLASLEDIL